MSKSLVSDSGAADAPTPVDDAERRASRARREARKGAGRRSGELLQEKERRQQKTPAQRTAMRAEVRSWINKHRLEPFVMLLSRIATSSFGPNATVMPHLRRSKGRSRLVVVIDAAFPLAATHYQAFLPLEQKFWLAYASLPKPPVPFMIGVRPSRGWSRAEALAPLFKQTQESGMMI